MSWCAGMLDPLQIVFDYAKKWRGRNRWRRWSSPFLMVAFAATVMTNGALADDIWFSAAEPVWRQINGWPPNDYIGLFAPNAGWRRGARYVHVFELSKRFINETDERTLRLVVGDLNRRGIAIAIQGTPLMASKQCGLGVESFGPPHDIAAEAERIQRVGGEVYAITMDEPLYYSQRFRGNDRQIACRMSISDAAAQAAIKIAEVRKIFPDVKVGDVEPIGISQAGEGRPWSVDLQDWIDEFKKANGFPLAFLQFDVLWAQPNWAAQLAAMAPAVHSAGVPFGIIYNGLRTDPTDKAWILSARHHVAEVEGLFRDRPHQAVFQTWTDRPRKMLPEQAGDSLTGLLLWYVRRGKLRTVMGP